MLVCLSKLLLLADLVAALDVLYDEFEVAVGLVHAGKSGGGGSGVAAAGRRRRRVLPGVGRRRRCGGACVAVVGTHRP